MSDDCDHRYVEDLLREAYCALVLRTASVVGILLVMLVASLTLWRENYL